jgi:invasin-like protein
MTTDSLRQRRPPLGGAFLGLLILFGMGSCGLDEVQVPPLIGPSELGLSVDLQASPDTINADGVSQSVVRLVARDQNGKVAPGRQILFQLIEGDGVMVAGSLVVGPLQGGLSLATDNAGVAQVVYTAGFSEGTATIGVRPYSFDGGVQPFLRTVRILQR